MKHKYFGLFLLLISTLSFGQAAKDPAYLPPFNFRVDSTTLLATWEAPKIVLLNEDFEGDVFPPEGWADTTLGAGWMQTNDPDFWFWHFPVPSGSFALVNDDLIYGNNGSQDYLVTPLLDLTVTDSCYLVFDSYFDAGYGQQAFIEYSLDNGNSWVLLYELSASLEWETMRVDLSEFSGTEGESNILLSFHADDNGYFASGWVIDNVLILSDKISQQPYNYKIFLDSVYISSTHSTSYQYSFEYLTTRTCAVCARYVSSESGPVEYTVHSVNLPKPDSLNGYAPDAVAILQWDPPKVMHGGPAESNIIETGDILRYFTAPDPITSCYGICDDGSGLWISDPEVSSSTIFKVTYEGVNTGETITVGQGQSWIGDMVSDGTYLYCCLIGGSNRIGKIDLATGQIITTIGGAFSAEAQMGLAADFENEEFYIGGWNSNMIWRTHFNGITISTHPFNNVSGLAWSPMGGPFSEGSLWVMVKDAQNWYSWVTEIDPNNNWVNMQSFQIPGGEPDSGAGIEMKTGGYYGLGSMWICNQVENKVYLVDLVDPLIPGPQPLIPENLLGFNLYRNGELRGYVECTAPDCCHYLDPVELSDEVLIYEVTALYNMTPYGYPSDTGESPREGPATISNCCFNTLNFFEDWSSGWSGNYWKTVSSNWQIAEDVGNAAPAVMFNPDSQLVNYRDSLQTLMIYNEFAQVDMTLTYDVVLSTITSSGNEKLLVQVNDYSNSEWTTIRIYDNSAGSFGWISETVNPDGYFTHDAFRIRFLAEGENSANISYWAVDNIALTRICTSPRFLGAYVIDPEEDTILLNWSEPMPPLAEWIQWDDGEHDGNMGWGDGKESWHSIAAHWTPALLQNFNGVALTEIGFIPSDPRAFFKVAVWTGENTTPVYVQATGNLVLDEYNIIQLEEPVIIDVTKDLYVGYLVSAYTGYPVSCDDGPAIDGFGNMTQGGNPPEWQTLLEINPDLDFNWNIKAFFERDGVPFEGIYRISRSIDDNEPEVIAETTVNEYYDSVEGAMGLYCYTVTCMFGDTCLYSDNGSEACIVLTQTPSIDPDIDKLIRIYPNPASGVLYIEAEEEIESVNIFDCRGETVKRWNGGTVERWNGEKVEIPLIGLAPGLYLVRVETGGVVVGRKVVIGR